MSRRHRGMRRSVAAGMALAALGATTALADGERYSEKSYGSYKAPEPAYAADPGYSSWTGPYIGIGIGARGNGIDWTTKSVTFDATGATLSRFPDTPVNRNYDSVGVQFNGFAGYNLQLNGIVLGAEGSISGAGDQSSRTRQSFPGADNLFNSTIANTFDSLQVSSGFGATLRGRLGVLIRPNILLYGTGGVAFQEFDFKADCQGGPFLPNASVCFQLNKSTQSISKTGWTVGGGLEAQLTSHWFARIEYAYAGLGSADLTFKFADNTGSNFATTMKSKVDLDTQTGTVGIAYKF